MATPPSQPPSNDHVLLLPPTEALASECESRSDDHEQATVSPAAFMGDGSLLAWPQDTGSTYGQTETCLPMEFGGILTTTKADELPPSTQLQASIDFFFKYLYCSLPIIERSELQNPGVLTGQTVHFLGSLLRSPDKTTTLVLQSLYQKLRVLLFVRVVSDKLAVLSVLVALSCWSPNSPDIVTLDASWHWIGSAVRHALQIGMHRESTYQCDDEAHRLRRLWWTVFNIEVLHGVSYGRPIMCRPQDLDVELPTLSDFAEPNLAAMIFIASSSLCVIISDIHDLSLRRRAISEKEFAAVIQSLRSWLESLPCELHLYDEDRRKPYDLSVSQLQLLYLTAVIACVLLPGAHRRSSSWSTMCFVASGCVAHIYDEINCHEDVHRLLPHHGWLITVASIPNIYLFAKFPSETASSAQALEILTSTVSQLAKKHASAAMVLRKIKAFQTSLENHPVLVMSDKDLDTSAGPSSPRQLELEQQILLDARCLLPFPEDHCHSMILLRSGAGAQDLDQFCDTVRFDLIGMDTDVDWSVLLESFANEQGGGSLIPDDVGL